MQDPLSETPVLVQLQAQPILSIRGEIRIADISSSHGERFQALRDHLKAHRLVAAGPPFVRYHTFGKEHTDAEVGVPVQQAIAGDGAIQAGHLPAGPALVNEHVGPHQQLGKAYRRLHEALQAKNLSAEGAAWEVYHWMDLSRDPTEAAPTLPERWHTTLVQPLKQP